MSDRVEKLIDELNNMAPDRGVQETLDAAKEQSAKLKVAVEEAERTRDEKALTEELEKTKEHHRKIKEKKELLGRDLTVVYNHWELLSCGITLANNEDRQHSAARLDEVALDIGTKLSLSDRLCLMVKHGRRALEILRRSDLENRPSGTTHYDEFCRLMLASPDYCFNESKRLEKLRTDHIGRDVTKTVLLRLFHAANWSHSGCNQFQLSPDLAAALMLTEVPKVDAEEMKLPYAVFVLTLPPGTVPFFAPGKDGTYQWADALWVEEDTEGLRWTVCWHSLQVQRRCTRDFMWQDAVHDQPEFVPDDEISFDAAAKLVRNFLLWLGAEGGIRAHRPEVIPKKLMEKRARSGKPWPRQWLFGKDVRLAPELKRAAAEIALGRSKRHAQDGWKVRARFTVRGHWRHQAHGPGRALRRRQWIAPFWKGPAGAEAWAHVYKAEEKTK